MSRSNNALVYCSTPHADCYSSNDIGLMVWTAPAPSLGVP